MKLLIVDILDEIFRFADKPQFVLYFKKLMSRQTIRVLYKDVSFDKQAEKGNLQTIKYLHLIGAKCTTDAMDLASKYEFLEVIKYLHETVGVKCSTHGIIMASRCGHLEIVKYLHKNVGANCTTDLMHYASGHPEVAKYIRENIIKN